MSVPTKCDFSFENTYGNVLAFFDVHYGDFVIRGFKVMSSEDSTEPWIAMPSKRISDYEDGRPRYLNVVWLPDNNRKKAFDAFVLSQYNRALEKERQNASTS